MEHSHMEAPNPKHPAYWQAGKYQISTNKKIKFQTKTF
jgi:hypothetical protein